MFNVHKLNCNIQLQCKTPNNQQQLQRQAMSILNLSWPSTSLQTKHTGVSTQSSIQRVQNQTDSPVQFTLIYSETTALPLQALNVENWELK